MFPKAYLNFETLDILERVICQFLNVPKFYLNVETLDMLERVICRCLDVPKIYLNVEIGYVRKSYLTMP